MLLEKRVILVTGGASGIGYACVKAYVKEGALVAVLDIDATALNNLMLEIGNDHLGVVCDVSDAVQIEDAIEKVVARYGVLNCIHNNAGIANPAKALHETSMMEWRRLMDVNLFSIYLTTKYGLEYLKDSGGCILNTGSMVGSMGQADHAAYAATKGAVNALTKSMAIDYAPFGIRVNTVAPAGVWTPMLRKWADEQKNTDEIENYLNDIHLLGYCPEGDVIADACVFLCSDKASFVTGCIMPVSGGAELGYRRS
ncbi:SDR family NAD(P)-dependent oxidoreductase [Chitinophagaceae bacterium 26-R-25]|nr:SDR family NAD(P)-dependent oxidoreductase [Chitinophagaceae bacterium 26-R-25]